MEYKMYIYINAVGEYPRFPGDIQVDFPEWEIGDEAPDGWIQVAESELEPIEENQTRFEVYPTEVDGEFVRTFEVRDLTSGELATRDAPVTAMRKLTELGFSKAEIAAISQGLLIPEID
jgi:microcystin-dependent protein